MLVALLGCVFGNRIYFNDLLNRFHEKLGFISNNRFVNKYNYILVFHRGICFIILFNRFHEEIRCILVFHYRICLVLLGV